MKNLLSTLITFCVIAQMAFAQTGTVRGTVIDDATGEPIMFGGVVVDGTTTGTETDLDGTFSLDLDPGTYTIVCSYVGYANYSAKDIVVVAGEVNALGTIRMKEESLQALEDGQEIVVTAKAIKTSDNALLTVQRKSANVLDAVSSQTFARVGDNNAAAAIKRVTGVSIEGGKHVFVRGLGDRYTKTLLNGLTIPGLDPDKNSVQMDIFPTNLLQNIVVYKTFTPDLPGDFTGGTVDVSLKEFPEEETFNVSAGFSVNPTMHFKSDFLTYTGSSTDFLGFDDGMREMPTDVNGIPAEIDARFDNALAAQLINATRSFNKEMAVKKGNSFMNGKVGLSYGNQINKNDVTYGYTVAANYAGTREFYENLLVARYLKDSRDRAATELELNPSRDNQTVGKQNVLWSALVSGAIKAKSNKFRLGVFRSQNATSTASRIITNNGDENPATLYKENLEYVQRSVTNVFLTGEHAINKGKFDVSWKVAPTFSSISEPDNRYTAYERSKNEEGETVYELARAVGGEIARVFRDLNETNIASKLDFTFNPTKGKVKFGAANTYKMRDYIIQDFELDFRGARDLTGNPNEYLENIWAQDNRNGTFVRGNFQPVNKYDAKQNTNAIYAMHEYPVSEAFKVIYGLRAEQFQSWYTGENALGNKKYDNDKVVDRWDLLPSLNLVYGIIPEKMNIRASFSRTVARPSFKEVSVAQIQDRLSGNYFYGNVDIKPSTINNFDLRWEYFMNRGEIISLSGFYKAFHNPIEIAVWQDGSFFRSDIITPSNGGDATLYGLELEVKKNLTTNFSGGLNFSAVKSSVKMSKNEIAARESSARTGETIGTTRQLVGQAPYIINAFLNFNTEDRTTEANLSYNVQGKRLKVIGLGDVPDLYEVPFHSLNFKVSHKFGKEDRFKGSFSANNILGSKRKDVYTSYGIDDTTSRLLNPGRSFSFGLSYKIK